MDNQPVRAFYEKYGRRLRRARENRGWTQEFVAGFLETTQPNISRLEQGRQEITLQVMFDLLRLYQITVEEFLGESSRLDD